jgi:D-xylose transport system substrate-binding protein
MKLFGGRNKTLTSIFGTLLLTLVLVACGSANTGSSGGSSSSAGGANGKGCTKVGILLPETATSFRWDAVDRPDLIKDIQAVTGKTPDYANAQGNADQQLTQAQADLTRGDCILVVAPSDATKAAQIVAAAKAQNVPVISYDRLIQSSDLTAYVSFDGVAVGKLQGEYIAQHYKEFVKPGQVGNTVMIDGAQTDNNALLFAQGAHDILDPLFKSGVLKNVYEKFTPNWDNPTAETEMEAALTANGNNIQIAYVANDGMASTVIAALRQQHLNGHVLVTGQDASIAGLQNIMRGDQSMTVFKDISLEAQATANVVKALKDGTSLSTLTNGATTKTQSGAQIPSVLETPQTIDKTNIMTVINAGFYTLQQVCQGMPSGSGGICP